MKSETAQKVLELGLKMQESFVKDLQHSHEKFVSDSQATLRKEWGAQFDSNIVAAQKVINKFGDPKLLEELHGLENSPAVMRTLARIGKAFGEDSIAIPGAHSAPAPEQKRSNTGNALVDEIADRLYPTMSKG
jgi:hypothetical protein